jgi:hypothetical protein
MTSRSLVRTLLCCLFLLLWLAPQGVAKSMTDSEMATRQWAAAYGLSGDYLWGIVLCESNGNPYAVGPPSSEGTPYGLAQIKPQTWAWLVQQENADTSLAPNLSTYDPETRAPDADAGAPEVHMLAWGIYHGYAYLWACA